MTDQDQTSQYEERARTMGWFPEDEWDEERAQRSGMKKPATFLSAEDFITKVEGELPILRQTNRALGDKVTRLEKEVTDQTSATTSLQGKIGDLSLLVEDMHRSNREIGKRAYEKGLREAQAVKKQAIEEGDHDAVDKADQTIADLEAVKPVEDDAADRIAADRQQQQQQGNGTNRQNPQLDPNMQSWVDANPWFMRDQTLNSFVIEEHGILMKERPGVPEHELLDEVKQMAVDTFPRKFGKNPKRAAPASVGNPGPGRGNEGDGKTFADIPKEDQDAYYRQKEYMAEKKIEFTKEEYVNEYYLD